MCWLLGMGVGSVRGAAGWLYGGCGRCMGCTALVAGMVRHLSTACICPHLTLSCVVCYCDMQPPLGLVRRSQQATAAEHRKQIHRQLAYNSHSHGT